MYLYLCLCACRYIGEVGESDNGVGHGDDFSDKQYELYQQRFREAAMTLILINIISTYVGYIILKLLLLIHQLE